MASAVFLLRLKITFLAPIPAGTFTIFSLFRVPVRFVLCPCQHPRLPCGSRRYRMRAHGNFTVSRLPLCQSDALVTWFPIVIDCALHSDEASARFIPQCIRFFVQRIVAAVHIVSVLALAVARCSTLCCCALPRLMGRIIAVCGWLVNRQSWFLLLIEGRW